MAEIIPIRDVPGGLATPSEDNLLIIDDGVAMRRATAGDLMDSVGGTRFAPIGKGIPDGGTSGQVLARQPGGEADWQDAGTGDMAESVYDPGGRATDAFDRSNHTGEQPISATEGLPEALSDIASSLANKANQSDLGTAAVLDAPDNDDLGLEGDAAALRKNIDANLIRKGRKAFGSVAGFLADTALDYGSGPDGVSAGDRFQIDSFWCSVLDDDAAEYDHVTDGGVKVSVELNQHLTLEAFGCVGDDDNDRNGTDDTAAFRRAMASGRPVYGRKDAIYRIEGQVDMAEGTWLQLLGARINFYAAGERCLQLGNYCQVTGGAAVAYGMSAVSGDKQCPIMIGQYSPSVTVHDVIVTNMTLEAAYSNCLLVSGGSYNVLVENITVPDWGVLCPPAATLPSAGVSAHWGGGMAGTFHPHDLVFRNIKIGKRHVSTFVNSALWLSGCYNVLVENLECEEVSQLAYVYCGDYGTNYTPEVEKPKIGKGIVLRNISSPKCRRGLSVAGGAFVSQDHMVEMGVTVQRMIAKGYDRTVANCRGIQVANATDVIVEDSDFDNFKSGLSFGNDITPALASKRITLRRSRINGSDAGACLVSLSAAPPEDVTLEANTLTNNNLSEDATFAGAAIMFSGSKRGKALGNIINGTKETAAVWVTSGAVAPEVRSNVVESILSGAAAFNINAATRGGNNQVASGITALTGGIPIHDGPARTASVDLPEIAAGARYTQAFTLSGAEFGDKLDVSFGAELNGLLRLEDARVTAANSVSLFFHNISSGTPVDQAAINITVRATKRV